MRTKPKPKVAVDALIARFAYICDPSKDTFTNEQLAILTELLDKSKTNTVSVELYKQAKSICSEISLRMQDYRTAKKLQKKSINNRKKSQANNKVSQ